MPSFLIQHGKGKNAVYTRLCPIISGCISKVFDYNRDDEAFEEHRNQDNRNAFSYVAKELKKMRIEAKNNGFGELSKPEQKATIHYKKREVESILREIGSFLPDEIPSVICRTSRLVEKIYTPYLKWARKKNNLVH